MAAYQLTLRNDKTRLYDRFALFLLLFQFVPAGWVLSSEAYVVPVKIAAFAVILLTLAATAAYLGWLQAAAKHILFSLAIVVAVPCWWLAGNNWAGPAILVLALLYFLARKKPIVQVSQAGVRYPSFANRHFSWQDIANIVLKDGLLTIDLQNNQLIQQPLDENNPAPNEADFNEFCRKQLAQPHS